VWELSPFAVKPQPAHKEHSTRRNGRLLTEAAFSLLHHSSFRDFGSATRRKTGRQKFKALVQVQMRKQGEMTYDLSPLPNDLHRCEGATFRTGYRGLCLRRSKRCEIIRFPISSQVRG
jgi:hypothetical protein